MARQTYCFGKTMVIYSVPITLSCVISRFFGERHLGYTHTEHSTFAFPESFLPLSFHFGPTSMSLDNKELYEFGQFRLDVTEHTLTRLDGLKNGKLGENAFQTLCILVHRRGHLVTKTDLITQIWPNSFVEDHSLEKCIHAIRQVLGETPIEQKYIQTVRKHGYRFVADVRKVAADGNGHVAVSPIPADAVETSASDAASQPIVVTKKNWRATATQAVLGVIVVVIASIGFYLATRSRSAVAESTSIAVLPLKPVNLANRNAFHEGGITDSLILRLSAVKGFTVRPLSAMRKYADVEQDPLAAGREQMVDYVLASNYQLSDGRIQVTAQFFDVKTGLVTETFKIEKDAGDSFVMQDMVAREIGGALAERFGIKTDSIISKRGTANENAYRYYLNAVNLMGRTSLPIAQESVEYLEEAVRLDPDFARAYAALARSRVELSNLVDDPGSDCNKARTALERALALDLALAEAYHASGLRKQRCEWDFAGAESDLRRALELDPQSDTAHAAYGSYLSTVGRFDEAIAETERAISLNPNSLVYHKQRGIILFVARQYDGSIAAFSQAAKLGQMGPANGWLWTAYVAKGEDRQAFETLLKYETEKNLKPDLVKIEQLKTIFGTSGWKGIREIQLEAEIASPIYLKGRFYRISRLAAQLGNNNDAFLYLNKAIERRDTQLLLLKFEPTFDSLRSDPRYPKILQRIGFPPDS